MYCKQGKPSKALPTFCTFADGDISKKILTSRMTPQWCQME
jgi:hypothetical protein